MISSVNAPWVGGGQMYGCNVLNLGGSRIISVNPASARQIVKDPHFTGDVQVPPIPHPSRRTDDD